MKYKDLKNHPLYWKYNHVWFIHKEWMVYFYQTQGIPIEIFIEMIKERILKKCAIS